MRLRNTMFWFTGCVLSFGLSVSLAGYIAITKSLRVRMTPAPRALLSSVGPLPARIHAACKPTVAGQRGVRYVDGGMLVSTAGLTAGVDATLHLLARRHGAEVAGKVAQGLNIPPSPLVENPKGRQFEFGPADGIFLLNAAFR